MAFRLFFKSTRKPVVKITAAILMVSGGLIVSGAAMWVMRTPDKASAETAATMLYRINAGGAQISGTPNWGVDSAAKPSVYGNASSTGNLVGSSTAAINMSQASMQNAGVPSSVFQTYRMDSNATSSPLKYTFPVTPGEYEVHLYFAETNKDNFKVGARYFNVLVEDGLMDNLLDVYKTAGGGNRAIKRTYQTSVLDNKLTVELDNVVKNSFVNAIEVVKIDLPGTWQGVQPTDSDRDEAAFAQVNGKFYLAGGNIDMATTADQEMFDPATNAWKHVAPLPEALNHIQPVVYNGLIYYVGGLHKWPGPETNTVYIYNPATNTFSQGATMPRGRGAGATVLYNGKIYYVGGLNGGNAVNWFDEYNPATNTWRQMPDMPTKKDHFHGAVIGNKLYAIAGRNVNAGALINENVAFDFTSNSWVTGLAPAPTSRGGFAAAVIGNEVIVMGGERRQPDLALNSVEAYNVATNTWRELAPLPLPGHGIAAAECNGGLYVPGGSKIGGDKGSNKNVFAFYLNDQVTTCTPPPPTPTVTVTATPSTLNKGETFVLDWSTTNAGSCTGKNVGYWGGSKPVSGSETLTANNNNTYTLTCTGPGGTAKAAAKVTVQ